MAFNFPNSPTIGQVFENYTWDGEKWVVAYDIANTSGVIAIKVFTASGTYIPSSNMTTCVVECVGGGGGGGCGQSATSWATGAGGGGAGAYACSSLTAAQVGASQTVTIGAAGAGGNPAAGGTGGTTSFGTLVIATGGAGGGQSSGGTAGIGGPGGSSTTSTGTITASGGAGFPGTGVPTTQIATSGTGGNSRFGAGGRGAISGGAFAGTPAVVNSGSGGGGGISVNAAGGAGGSGGSGIVVITEYGMTALTGTDAGAVRYDLLQGLTAPQQAVARANIGVTQKNYIINGGMQVSQENGVTAGATSGWYAVDMFFGSFVIGSTMSVVNVSVDTPGGSTNRIRITASTVDATIAATDHCTIITKIEGTRLCDLGFGKPWAKTFTLRFGCKGPAGNYAVAFMNSANNRHYVSEFVISAGEANTDIIRTITVQADSTGTWLDDTGVGVQMRWVMTAGTTYQSPSNNTWVAGTSLMGLSTTSNFNGTAGNVFELFDVGLYEGSVAPPYVLPDIAAETQLCQRYFSKNYLAGSVYVPAAATAANLFGSWNAYMRSTPTLSFIGISYGNGSGVAAHSSSPQSFAFTWVGGAAGMTAISGYIVGNARL